MIVQMMDKHGTTQTNRMSIANVFATFYEELYSRRVTEDAYEANGQVEGDSVPAFTENELLKALKLLKKWEMQGHGRDKSRPVKKH